MDGSLAPEKIIKRVIVDEVKTSFLDYAMSVIVSRALPDVRDGLKPVHRRILYAMQQMGMFHDKPFKKSARIVGEVLGKYHPHGDTAVYDALVRMAQDFSLRYPLIDGQGNFGSVDGDAPAAMRYTESRLARPADDMLDDIEKDTVDFVPNFDGSLEEPSVLPARLPNLLVNGSSGIAVGMATNIPPHNVQEVVNAAIVLIDNPETTVEQLMQVVSGPDFPTGGQIAGRQGIAEAYRLGRGKILVKGRVEVEEQKNRQSLVISEIPYMVNKTALIEEMADLVRSKKITGISDIRDESDRDGMRIVIELKSGVQPEVVSNQLYQHSRLQVTFGIIMLALVNNEPKILNLKDMLAHYLSHRQTIVCRRTQFDLIKAEKRAHILEGLVIALGDIDKAIRLIKEANSVEEAKASLIGNYQLTDVQAAAILDMKLQRLTSLEQNKIRDERSAILTLIAELNSILADPQKVLDIIKRELLEVRSKYGDGRKTDIVDGHDASFEEEDLIEEEDMVVTITHAGYIKRVALSEYKQQKRGGKGIIAASTREEDLIEDIFTASTHAFLLFFTNKGKVHWLKVYQIPEAGRAAGGKAIVNLLQLEQGEKITACVPVREFDDKHFLFMATKQGTVKKTALDAFSRPRRDGIIAINLDEGDHLINVVLTSGEDQIILATTRGLAIRFAEKDVRPIGRSGMGVRGIALKTDDEVIGMVKADDAQSLFTVTEHGYGKRSMVADYRLVGRGGVGVRNIICSERNGLVVTVHSVQDKEDVLLISEQGIIIRTPVRGISIIGRNTQGVRLMRLKPDDKVVAAAKIVSEDEGAGDNT